MGAAPYASTVTLTDTAENLSVGLKAFTDGQIASFNRIKISDNATLVLDPATFKKLDTANVDASWSNHDGTTVVNNTPTYTQSGTTVTVLSASHGRSIGDSINL